MQFFNETRTFGKVTEVLPIPNLMALQVGMDFSSGQPFQGAASQFAGWLARDEGWVLQAGPTSLTLHLVRPGAWPAGKYMGWSAIYGRFVKLHESLGDVYGPLEIKRAGVRYLNRIAIPDVSTGGSGFIVLPPWYRKPRFEVTLLLTILAGLLFSICWGLWELWQKRNDTESKEKAIQSVKQRVRTATSVAALTGLELALVTYLRY